MKKKSNPFVCNVCGAEHSRWAGKCDSCGSWNSIQEFSQSTERFSPNSFRPKGNFVTPTPLTEIGKEKLVRISTGLAEFDQVLGGGIVPGSLNLIGGEPGVGKSTLILEISKSLCKLGPVLYVSGEESSSQIGLRASRLGLNSPNLLLSSESYVEMIRNMVESILPIAVFIDSIQTVQKQSLEGQVGSVTQLRESTAVLLETAKKMNIPIFLIGHITKEGAIAGPKVLEHLVDTVIYFEGDKVNYFRILRAVKNRFGSVGEIAVFEMIDGGLKEVQDRSRIFLSEPMEPRSGSVITSVMEGSRSIAIEVQALVSGSNFSNPRRMAEGLDSRRLVLISAVLEKYRNITLSTSDIFANLAGGIQVDETATDLALCTAILSSFSNVPVSPKVAYLGEVGLSGEVRSIGQIAQRVKDLAGIGISKIIVPKSNLSELKNSNSSLDLVGIDHIRNLEFF